MSQCSLADHKTRSSGSDATSVRSAELKNHNIYNLVSHSEQQEQGRIMWFLLAASCYVRVLQVTGYFPVIKTKVPGELDQDEKMIGGLMVELIQKMQFNTHAITEATDFLPAKYVMHSHQDTLDLHKSNFLTRCRKLIMNGEFENRTRVIGTAIYPTFALFNHSCDNNTYKYFVGDKVYVVASKVRSLMKAENVLQDILFYRIFMQGKRSLRIIILLLK